MCSQLVPKAEFGHMQTIVKKVSTVKGVQVPAANSVGDDDPL